MALGNFLSESPVSLILIDDQSLLTRSWFLLQQAAEPCAFMNASVQKGGGSFL